MGYEIGKVYIVELAESPCDAIDMYEAFSRLASRAEDLTVSSQVEQLQRIFREPQRIC